MPDPMPREIADLLTLSLPDPDDRAEAHEYRATLRHAILTALGDAWAVGHRAGAGDPAAPLTNPYRRPCEYPGGCKDFAVGTALLCRTHLMEVRRLARGIG